MSCSHDLAFLTDTEKHALNSSEKHCLRLKAALLMFLWVYRGKKNAGRNKQKRNLAKSRGAPDCT